jgi:hypothetical protein
MWYFADMIIKNNGVKPQANVSHKSPDLSGQAVH